MDVAGVLFELGFEAGEQVEGIGGRAGKTGEDLCRCIACGSFWPSPSRPGRAEGDLSVGGHDHRVTAADA